MSFFSLLICIILLYLLRNIKVNLPFPVEKESQFKTFTYFDTIGRPTVLIEKDRLIDELFESVKVYYLDFMEYVAL